MPRSSIHLSSLLLRPRFTLLVSGLALFYFTLCLPPVIPVGSSLSFLLLQDQLLLILQVSTQMSSAQLSLPRPPYLRVGSTRTHSVPFP